MNKVLTITQDVPSPNQFNAKQIEILKNSICKGVSNEEFEVFIMACTKTQLDPFMRQIYAVKRKQKKPDGSWGDTMTIQTGIDGYRLIAERTGCYAPGIEPTYTFDDKGNLISACAYIKKLTRDGTWHTISASAYLDEYQQTITDKQTGEKKPSGMWVNMPKTMLAKCAEAQALRKAFPAEMSGVYTKEEMEQSEPPKIDLEQCAEIELILDDCDPMFKELFFKSLRKNFGSESISDIPLSEYSKIQQLVLKNMHEYRKKQSLEYIQPIEAVQ